MTHDIDALIAAADLADATDRLMLADALEEAGLAAAAAGVRAARRPLVGGGPKSARPAAEVFLAALSAAETVAIMALTGRPLAERRRAIADLAEARGYPRRVAKCVCP